jgi:hypothetical protein
MNDCLWDQTITRGLCKDQAVLTCGKLLQDHMKGIEQQLQTKTNKYKMHRDKN